MILAGAISCLGITAEAHNLPSTGREWLGYQLQQLINIRGPEGSPGSADTVVCTLNAVWCKGLLLSKHVVKVL